MRRSIRIGTALLVLFAAFATPLVGSAVAQSSDSAASDADERRSSGHETSSGDADEKRCFPPGGHELGVGTEGPGISMTVHTSLFSNLGGEGALGLEARGTALNATIVSLRTGVVFDGVGDAGAFLSNPFDAFAIVFDYSFDLPMFSPLGEDRSSYDAEGSPVTGVETRDC